ncbi:pol polyprotein [Nephila pilipes]|uniref:Pol polyprotein n=1 Tax=Nephila pilipes TaxID=299642 RepID=A0A8X6NLT9_NEPPI|nr:pol polyprotein [Nephila pilipes]
MKKVKLPNSGVELYCDLSANMIRPYIPEKFRKISFDSTHNLAYPLIKTTSKLVRKPYVWSGINKDCIAFSKQCIPCQRSKVRRHTSGPLQKFRDTSTRFDHVHLDITRPLPPSKGFTYCLTTIDRFTRWIEATPLPEIQATAISDYFYSNWIAHFGVPCIITTDQGRQFESCLFRALARLLGVERMYTTAYLPQSNGLPKEFHGPLKAAIMCHTTDKWTVIFWSTTFIGFGASLKENIGCTLSELAYGKTLRLPGEFFDFTQVESDTGLLFEQLRHYMQQLRPIPMVSHAK